MMDRILICGEICRHAHVKQQNPTRTSLSKNEMVAVWKFLIHQTKTIDQLQAELAVLKSGKVGSGV